MVLLQFWDRAKYIRRVTIGSTFIQYFLLIINNIISSNTHINKGSLE